MKSWKWKPVYGQVGLRDATFKIQDGTSGTPNSITVKIGEGSITWSEGRNVEYSLNRGRLDEVREGDEMPMDVSFEFIWSRLYSDGESDPVTPYEALTQTGEAAEAWVSSDTDDCRPYAVTLIVEIDQACGANKKETITFPNFRFEKIDPAIKEGTISVSGKCNAVRPTIVREEEEEPEPEPPPEGGGT